MGKEQFSRENHMICNGKTNRSSYKGLLTLKIFKGNLLSEKVEKVISANFKSLHVTVNFLKKLRQYATISLRNHNYCKIP